MANEISRSEAMNYFSHLSTELDGILFWKQYAYFISQDIQAIVTVSGSRVREVLFGGYREECRRSNYSLCKLQGLERKMLAYYDNLIFFDRRGLCELLSQYNVRPKKKGKVSFSCKEKILTITLHIGGIEIPIQSEVCFYEIHHGIKFSDFYFEMNALVMDKIICHGFGDCDRIGMKFSHGTDIIFFNKNKRYFNKYWAASPVLCGIEANV